MPQPGDHHKVPPPLYFHGTKAGLQSGDRLTPGTVAPAQGDNRLRVWATTCERRAWKWARLRPPHDGTPKVYRVHLDDPEIDVNMHASGTPGPFTEVMARSGYVIERMPEEPDSGG